MSTLEQFIDVGRLLASIATPIIIAILGYALLRRVEQTKAGVAKHSDFQIKWADEFFKSCQEFLTTIEKEMAILAVAGKTPATTPELNKLNQNATELELRIRRCTAFAPTDGPSAADQAQLCIKMLRLFLEAGGGDTTPLLMAMEEFNKASKKAHAEMLEVSHERMVQTANKMDIGRH